jgi:hypothetical protein
MARRSEYLETRGRRKSRLRQVLTLAGSGLLLAWGMKRRGPLAWALRLAGARLAGRAARRA